MSVKINVLLTCVELTGLLIIIVIGLWAIGAGEEYTDLTYQDDVESRAIYDELVRSFQFV